MTVIKDTGKVLEKPYRQFLGKLMWITKVRPDLTCATNLLCRVAHAPSENSWITLKRAFRYFDTTKEQELTFMKTEGDINVTGFCDASLADAQNCRSTGSGWRSECSCYLIEAELYKMKQLSKTILFVKRLAREIGLDVKETKLHIDSKVSIDVLKSFQISNKSRHFCLHKLTVKRLLELTKESIIY